MQNLEQRVAIITGASSGIGRAAALLLAREGARVVLGARRQPQLDDVVREIEQAGGQAIAVAGDVADESVACRLVQTATEQFGGLDIAFNNAGTVGESAPSHELSSAAWRETIDVNLTGAFLTARYQIPAMMARGGGSIVFTSSFVGHSVGMPGMVAYAASKAGMLGLTRALAAELGQHRIRVNAILPGGTDTPSNIVNAPGATPEVRSFVENLHALKRLATPDEIAQSVLYLCSDASSFVTGTAMLVDGGVSIART
jgi:NAD(P)-dependent dehydrogenase (short-subunit alcohol dehydrogenase family)